MQARITKELADGLKAAEKPYEVFDARHPGLILRTQPSGSRNWFFAFRLPHGVRGRLRLGHYPGLSVDGARKLALDTSNKVAKGIDPRAERKEARARAERDKVSTLRTFLEHRYEPWAQSHLKTGQEQVDNLRAHFATWLDKPMVELTVSLAEDWRADELKGGKKPATVNRDLQRVQSALAKAVQWCVLMKHPLEGLKPLKTDRKGRMRYLSAEESASVRKALLERETSLRAARERFNTWRRARHFKELPERTGEFVDHVRPLVLLALNTGLRRGELLSLRWRHLDLTGKQVTVEGTTAKTGQTRHVPLNAESVDLMKRWCAFCEYTTADDFVFAVTRGQKMTRVDHGWSTVMKLAGVTSFRFHDCRHHFASKLVMQGVPLNTVRELLGHSSLEMTLRYAHLAPDNLSAAVEQLAA
jgi:integrase